MIGSIDLLKKIFRKIRWIFNDSKRIKQIYIALYIVGGIFLLFVLLNNWNQFIASLKEINLLNLLIPLVLYPLGMIPTASAWHFLLKLINKNRFLMKDIYLYNLSIFSKHIPGYIWFLGSRSLVYKEENISSKNTVFLTFLETILLSLTGYVLSLPLIWINSGLFPKYTMIVILIFCFVMILLLVLISRNPSRNLLNRFSKKFIGEDFEVPSIMNVNLVFSILSMFLAWIGGGLLLSFVIWGFIPIQVNTLFLACGIWGFAGAVSLSLGLIIQGFGIREVTIALMLSTILSPIQAVTASILFRLIITLGEIIWVVFISLLFKSHLFTKNSWKSHAN